MEQLNKPLEEETTIDPYYNFINVQIPKLQEEIKEIPLRKLINDTINTFVIISIESKEYKKSIDSINVFLEEYKDELYIPRERLIISLITIKHYLDYFGNLTEGLQKLLAYVIARQEDYEDADMKKIYSNLLDKGKVLKKEDKMPQKEEETLPLFLRDRIYHVLFEGKIKFKSNLFYATVNKYRKSTPEYKKQIDECLHKWCEEYMKKIGASPNIPSVKKDSSSSEDSMYEDMASMKESEKENKKSNRLEKGK